MKEVKDFEKSKVKQFFEGTRRLDFTKEGEDIGNITRREFLKRLRDSTIRTCFAASLSTAAILFATAKKLPEIETKKKESVEVLDSVYKEITKYDELKVAHFAPMIVSASKQIKKSSFEKNCIYVLCGWYLGDFLGGLTFRKFSKNINSLGGGGSFLIGRGLDVLSTYSLMKAVHGPKFYEYGLDTYFFETNPFLGTTPSPRKVVLNSLIITLLPLYGVSYLLPGFGRGYLGASPFIASNNLQVKTQALYYLKLGDKVDEMIKQRKSVKEIEYFLENVKPDHFYEKSMQTISTL